MAQVAHQREIDLEQARQRLQVTAMQAELSEGALEARRAQYEAAREQVSRFFTSAQAEADKTNSGAFGQEAANLQPLLKQRDELITLLARSDPGSADRLSNLDEEFRKHTQQK